MVFDVYRFASNLLLIFIFCSLFMPLGGVVAVMATEASWASKASMPTTRIGFGVAVVNEKIYAIGGSVGGSNHRRLNVTEEYNRVTNTWTTKAPMPTPRCNFGIAVYEDKIYVIGGITGYDSNASVSLLCDVNEVYDPSTDTWETKSSMPTKRESLGASVVDGKIYLIGGYPNATLNEVYDPTTDSWTAEAPTPTSAQYCSSAVIDNRIYVISGGHMQIYDPSTDTWSVGTDLPTELSGVGVATTTGTKAPKRIYALGGQKRGLFETVDTNYVYHPEAEVWTMENPLPTARVGVAVTNVDDMLYVMGGAETLMAPPSEYLTQNLEYKPLGYIPEFLPWHILPLFIVATLLAAITYRKLTTKTSKQ